MMKLENKVAIITGSTRGIGRATAKLFAAEGAKVVVVGTNAELGENCVAEIKTDGGEAVFCKTDVTSEESLSALVKVALDCTESNISVSEALKYVKYVKALDPAKITSDTVPYLGNPGRYVELDEDGIKELVNERIYGIAPQSSTEEQEENQFNESNQEGNQLNEDV